MTWRQVVDFALDHETDRLIREQLDWIAQEPANPRPYYQLAQLYRMQWKQDEGLALLLEAVRLNEAFAEAHAALTEIYAVRSDYAAAWRHARAAAQNGDNSAVDLLERHRIPCPETVRAKFGGDYVADARTFVMGIDRRFTAEIAGRYRNRRVLETCTGAGFTTIALARAASHVITVEIDPAHQAQARHNLATAGLLDRVTFLLADIMHERTWDSLSRIDAAFLDPDWAVTGPDHVHRFVRSSTRPPADALLQRTFRATRNVALVLPPTLDIHEFDALPAHELQKLYLDESHELYCLYFGDLAVALDETELRV